MIPPEPNNDLHSLQYNIDQFSDKLVKLQIDAITSNKLNQLSVDLVNSPEQWFQIDLFSVFQLNNFGERIRADHSKVPLWFKILEVGRNIVILLPILLTWLGLAFVIPAYTQRLSNNPSENFLAFWENGGGDGILTFFSFGKIASWDAFFIILVIIFTFFLMVWNFRNESKVEKLASDLSIELGQILWQVNHYLRGRFKYELLTSEQRSIQILENIDAFVNVFSIHSQELDRTIELEKQRITNLADFRQKEIEGLSTFSQNLQSSAKDLYQFGSQLLNTLQSFQNSASSFSSEVNRLSQTQSQVNTTLQLLETHFAGFERVIQSLSQIQERTSNELINATNQNKNRTDDLSVSVGKLSSSTREMLEGQIKYDGLIQEQMTKTDGWISSLNLSMNRIYEFTKIFEGLRVNLQTFSENFNKSSHNNEQIVDQIKIFSQENKNLQAGLGTLGQTNYRLINQIDEYGKKLEIFDLPVTQLPRIINELASKLDSMVESNNQLLKFYKDIQNESEPAQRGFLGRFNKKKAD